MWIKRIDKRHAEVKMYGNIGSWYTNGDRFTEILDACEAEGYEVLTIRMHCYGGSVFEGTAMYNAMQRSALKIYIVIEGVAASMACFILSAIENVSIADNAYGMIHRPSSVETGDADSHLNIAKLLQDMEANFIKRISERSKMAEDEIKAMWFDGKNHWLNASEMKQYGFVKEIIPATAKNIADLDKEIIAEMNIEGVYAKYAACLDMEPNNENQNEMKKLIIEAFGLAGVTAESSDDAVMQKLREKFSENENRLKAIETEAKAKQAAAVKAMLDKAGVPVDQRATFEAIGEKVGVEAVAMAIGNMGDVVIIDSIKSENKPGAESAEPKTFEELVAKGEDFIKKFKEENKDKYVALFKAEHGRAPKDN